MKDKTLKDSILLNNDTHIVYNINLLEEKGICRISALPFSARILIENLARNMDSGLIKWEDIVNAAQFYEKGSDEPLLVAFYPSRVLMQDFTGVPAVVDFAAMRDAVAQTGHDPARINPMVPVDLVIDHSIQVDYFREKNSFFLNTQKEYERNRERYQLLKWAQESFDNFRVVPPGSGICHQVNLEYLADVVTIKNTGNGPEAFPDTLVGTDSHTTMINALGVLGWGVGGIEAEAVMLGQPYYMNLPGIVGVNFKGKPERGITSTDIALTVTNILRKENVVEKIVEYTGTGLKYLNLTDRATISNMSPEYGATAGFFPVDEHTIDYLEKTGRNQLAKRVETYCMACSMFNFHDSDLKFSKTIDIDLSAIEPVIAGPSRPQDKISLSGAKDKINKIFDFTTKNSPGIRPERTPENSDVPELSNGSIVIAAITSCTNTSNPYTMIGAGLAAKNAVEKGLQVPWYVKTSLSPGSRVVLDYLNDSGLMQYLGELGFNNTGFGCMTCIGNSGPLDPYIEKAVTANNLEVMSVLSGNRNFEARIHQNVKGNFLMSPILVVFYALAGRIDIDFHSQPIGKDRNSNPVFLKDIWPDPDEITAIVKKSVKKEFFTDEYMHIFEGDKAWRELGADKSETFRFVQDSTYIRNPPFFRDFSPEPGSLKDIKNARALLVLKDSVTTDHISPAGAIPEDYPAGKYLIENKVKPDEFNSYGSRRGNHEVMMRGTFANIRIKNALVDKTGGFTMKFPEKTIEFVFDAAQKYRKQNTDLIVFGGREYGTGSSRDWAAKGVCLLGVKAVIAVSFERIHRSNLVGMGVLPLVFRPGESFESLGLEGDELFDLKGLDRLAPDSPVTVIAKKDGRTTSFQVTAKLNTDVETEYIKNGGILHHVLKSMIA